MRIGFGYHKLVVLIPYRRVHFDDRTRSHYPADDLIAAREILVSVTNTTTLHSLGSLVFIERSRVIR